MARKFLLTMFSLVCCVFGQSSCFALGNKTFLDDGEIQAIRALIAQGEPLYLAEYEALLARAEQILTAKPPTITENVSPNGKNYFYTESPYCGWFNFWGLYGDACRDGQINPDANREDYEQAQRMGVESVVLALSYRLSEEPSYLAKLKQFFQAWMLDPQTMMAPQYTTGQSRIEISVANISLFYAVSLVAKDLRQSPELYRGVVAWLQGWGQSIDSWQAENNFEDWRLTVRLAIFSLLEDAAQIDRSIAAVKARLPRVISKEGMLVHEISRTKSLSYSLYALLAMVLSAEIAYHHGVDLYQYSDTRGIGLKDALLFHANFLPHQKLESWPYKQIEGLKKHEVAMYELAYKRYGEAAFLRVIEDWQRPFTEIRALRYISLTHRLAPNP